MHFMQKVIFEFNSLKLFKRKIIFVQKKEKSFKFNFSNILVLFHFCIFISTIIFLIINQKAIVMALPTMPLLFKY